MAGNHQSVLDSILAGPAASNLNLIENQKCENFDTGISIKNENASDGGQQPKQVLKVELPPASPCLFCGSSVIWQPRGSNRTNCDGCEPMPGSRSPLMAVVEAAWLLVGEDLRSPGDDQGARESMAAAGATRFAWVQIYPRSSWSSGGDAATTVVELGTDGEPIELDASDYFFPLISPADRVYLTTKFPKSSPNCRHRDACSFCGGRTKHNPLCVTLRDDWHAVMPWGKHKGEHLAVMAADDEKRKYLEWVLASGRAMGELREDVERVLGIERRDGNGLQT